MEGGSRSNGGGGSKGSTTRRRSVRQVFVVSPARSGSTLLRYLLDTHPEIVSPPELNLSSLLTHVVSVWSSTNTAMGATADGADPNVLAPDVRRRARKVIDDLMVDCANKTGASVFCDKSLSTVEHLSAVTQCYPDAAYIFLYRYPLDLIASGLEASRWGFQAFGFAPYVAGMPGNFIAGLTNYWLDKATKMIEFERGFTGNKARIYYELLCDDPRETLNELFDFLDLPPDETVIQRVFERDHGQGPGDYKVDYSGAIGVDSIGRGASLPEMMSPDQVTRMNELLAEIDYPSLEAVRRSDLASLMGLKNATPQESDRREVAEAVAELISKPGADKLANAHLGLLPIEVVIQAATGDHATIVVDEHAQAAVANSNGGPQAAPTDDQPQDGNGRPRVLCNGDVLLRVAAGEISFANAVRDRAIQVTAETAKGEHSPRLVLAALAALIRAAD